MRRCFTLLMVLIAFAAGSCDDKTKEEIADVIVLSRSSVAFAVDGGTTTISVASPSEWKADCPDKWVTLLPGKDYLTICVDENATAETRNAKITVKSATSEHEISLSQAYLRDAVHLSLTASDEIHLDSEGDSSIFTVTTNGEWTAESKDEWLTVKPDTGRSTLVLSTEKNPGAHRSTTLTVTATLGNAKETREVAVSQISYDENPYFKMLGYFGLYAKNWYFGGDAVGISGTGTFCTIEEKEYRKSVYIKDLFIKGTVVEATYNKQTGVLLIELGKLCMTQETSPGTNRYLYLTKMNIGSGKFSGGSLTGTLGEGYNDIAGQTREAIHLSGFDSTYATLGITIFQPDTRQYASFSDVYYATGSMYLVRADKSASASASAALSNAAAGITPPVDGISAYNY